MPTGRPPSPPSAPPPDEWDEHLADDRHEDGDHDRDENRDGGNRREDAFAPPRRRFGGGAGAAAVREGARAGAALASVGAAGRRAIERAAALPAAALRAPAGKNGGKSGGKSADLGAGMDGRGPAPLVPTGSIAGRSLVTVIAIMTFLAAFAAGLAERVGRASIEWQEAVAREATIQVRPQPGEAVEAAVERAAALARATRGIEAARAVPKAESDALLEPWLGRGAGRGLELGDVPVPRLVVLTLGPGGAAAADLPGLRDRLANELRGATLDDHSGSVARLSAMAGAVVAVALGLVGLVVAATALAVAFATQGAMAGNREIIDVLHFVGAGDSFIARQFQGHFLRLGLAGGVLGAVAVLAVFALAGLVSSSLEGSPGGAQLEALFGSFSLSWAGVVAVTLVAALVAAVTATVSRLTVHRHLTQPG